MALLALDDTDTRAGGCTTYTAYRIAVALHQAGGVLAEWGLLAPPRLVRLAPTIRDKTRGNGALVLPIGRATATGGVEIGITPDDAPMQMYPQGDPAPPDRAETRALAALVDRHLPTPAERSADPRPGVLLLPQPTDPGLYAQAVVRRVTADEAWQAAPAGTRRLTPAGRRGEIGALAAAAWRPRPEAMTWEAIGYRHPEEERVLPPGFAEALSALESGFDNVAPTSGRVRAVPRTPCPVRFGVRGLDPGPLLRFARPLWCDRHGRGGWLLQTNQARGDHLRHAGPVPGTERVVRLEASVTGLPATIRGGHVFVAARTHEGSFTLAAFEPTKALRAHVLRLVPGDRLVVYGRCGGDPSVVGIEAFQVSRLAPRTRPGPNPRCPTCGGAMKSRGQGAGFRCRACHLTVPEAAREQAVLAPEGLHVGQWVQVPDEVRGHLLPPAGGLPPARALREGAPRLASAGT